MWGPQTQQLGGRVWAPTLEESCPPGQGGGRTRLWAACRWGRGVEWVAALSPRSVEVTWGFQLAIPAVAGKCAALSKMLPLSPSPARFLPRSLAVP